MKNPLIVPLIVLTALSLSHLHASANVVANGDFSANAAAFPNQYYYSSVNGNVTITDWTESSLSREGIEINDSNEPYTVSVFGPNTYDASTDPAQFALVQYQNTLTQDLTLAAGTYNISFESAVRDDANGGDPVVYLTNDATSTNVLLFDSAATPVTMLQGNDTVGADFTTTTGSFIATGNSTLVLENLDPSDIDATADFANIIITPVITTPEPSTYALMFAGLGTLLLLARLRRRAQG